MDYIKQLKELRTSLANRRVSLLVGSGFSKNVSSSFPNWAELLQDLVSELYQVEIEEQTPVGLNTDAIAEWKKHWIKRRIDKEGYLDIVSAYIRKKGMAESIVTYIEKKIPIVEDASGKYYLIDGDRREELTPMQLNLHRQLLTLPWNNVYTTNYDPLLEASIDTSLYHQLLGKNNALFSEITDLDTKISEATLRKEGLEKQKDALPKQEKVVSDDSPAALESSVPKNDQDRQNLFSKVYQELQLINRLNADRDLKIKEINTNEESLNSCFTVVTNGADLQLKRNRNIIKLHGSLRTEKERLKNKFEFDGDPRKQYIIASEHYENYPHQHEAFTQLMRISLLQESYCTIGFSGVDPNFLAWIGWVRDLLHKHAAIRDKNDRPYKIYQIDTSRTEVEADRLLFNENHSIVQIPLRKPEIIDFLQKDTQQRLDTGDEYKSALQILLRFLGDHENINFQIGPKDIVSEKLWRNVWGDVLDFNQGVKISNTGIEKGLEVLTEIDDKFQIPKLQDVFTHNLDTFRQIIEDDIHGETNAELKDKKLRVALLGAEKYFLPIRACYNRSMLDELSKNSTTSARINVLIERDDAMLTAEGSEKEIYQNSYNDILNCAFSFRFDELQTKLNAWNPKVEELHLKAGFLAAFKPDEAKTLLQSQIESDAITEEQRNYSLELFSYIERSMTYGQGDERIERKRNQYKKAGYPSVIDHLDSLRDELMGSKERVTPLGQGRFSLSNSVKIGGTPPAKPSLQYLMILIHSGFPVSMYHMYLHSPDEWYHIFKAGFEYYPFPYLYYSLQYAREAVLRRIAQDVIYSDELIGQHSLILTKIARAYFIESNYRKDSIIIFLPELFRTVKPEVWESIFSRIWKILLESGNLFTTINDSVEKFINAGLRFTETEGILFAVVENLLENLIKHSRSVIGYLFVLNENILFTANAKQQVPHSLGVKIDELIAMIPKSTENILFTLGNLNFLLSDKQKGEVRQQLHAIDFTTIINPRIWRTISFFSKGDSMLNESISNAIAQFPTLWDTGIKSNTVSAVELLRLHRLSGNIKFSDNSLLEMYQRMKPAFEGISELHKKRPDLFDQESIVSFAFHLEEMKLFLDSHKNLLGHQPDFADLQVNVNNLFNVAKGYSNLIEGLSSHVPSVVVWSLGELSSRIEDGEVDAAALIVVLIKLVLQAPPAIEEALNYLTVWMEDEKQNSLFANNKGLIISILQKFKVAPSSDGDIAFVEEMLVRIACVLRKWKVTDPIIAEWTSRGKTSRFNNVRQWIAANSLD